jgi:hypothetical protein
VKKWIVIGTILICCLLFALVKFRKPQSQKEPVQPEKAAIETQTKIDNADKPPLVENPDSTVPVDQVEAVLKAFEEFQRCIKEGDYKQAWESTSKNFRSNVVGSFDEFKSACDQLDMANVTIQPESACYIKDQVAFQITGPSLEGIKMYFLFVEEDGKWRLNIGHDG